MQSCRRTHQPRNLVLAVQVGSLALVPSPEEPEGRDCGTRISGTPILRKEPDRREAASPIPGLGLGRQRGPLETRSLVMNGAFRCSMKDTTVAVLSRAVELVAQMAS